MKLLLVVAVSLFLSNALTFAGELPLCEETSMENCSLKEKDAFLMTIDMMLENKEGTELLAKTGTNGLMLNPQTSTVKVTLVSTNDAGAVVKYEIDLLDCRGTDDCGGAYVWTVIASTESDGYTSKTIYVNTISKVQ